MEKSKSTDIPQAKSISLPSADEQYTPLLKGQPETVSMVSGYMVLQPGEAVGMHSTGEHEEMLVPLAGCGELRVPGTGSFTVHPGCVLYNPPNTLHDVVNTGDEPLRYIFVVAGVG